MRLGLVLRRPWADDLALAEELGFDLAWIAEQEAHASLVVAAGVAARTSGIRIVAEVEAGPHPVALAEEAAVADLATAGRLTLALRSDDEELLSETVEVLFQAFAARPFAHEGPRWRVPARFPEHEHAEDRVRVTPPPAQLEPSVWLAGAAGPAVARAACLSFVGDGLDRAADWDAIRGELGLAAERLRRPAVVSVPDEADAPTLVGQLLAAREEWGLDVAVLDLDAALSPEQRRAALADVARSVRPRLQLDRLPAGLDDTWRDSLDTTGPLGA